jgi:hypothetical protein
MFRTSFSSNQHCCAQGTGDGHPGRYPQDHLITRDKCILDSLPSARVSCFYSRQPGPLGLDLCTHRRCHVETFQASLQRALEDSAE